MRHLNFKKGTVYVLFLFTVVFASSCGEEFILATGNIGQAEKRREVAKKNARNAISKRVAVAIGADPAIAKIKAALAKRSSSKTGSVAVAIGADPAIAKIKAALAKRAAEVTAKEVEEIKMVLTRFCVTKGIQRVVEAIRKANPNKITSEVATVITAFANRERERFNGLSEIERDAASQVSLFSGGPVFEAFEQAVSAIIEADPKVAKRKEAMAAEVKEKAKGAETSVTEAIRGETIGEILREVVEVASGKITKKVIREIVKKFPSLALCYFSEMEADAIDAIVEAAMGNPARAKERSTEATEGVWKAIDSWLDSKRETP